MRHSKLNILIAFLLVLVINNACSDSIDLRQSVIGHDGEKLDSTSLTYEFDKWLYDEFVKTYNVEVTYKMKDIEADASYNLVPPTLEQATKLAKLIKYLWYDAYASVAPTKESFMKENSPRYIQIIGSPAYNPVSGTETLGVAEGGLKITLYKCNDLNEANVALLNEFYFSTMHHEFAHILHQKIRYPADFNEISKGDYLAVGWEKESQTNALKLGFISKYGRSAVDEDFVEIIANYITKSDEAWNKLLNEATDTSLAIDGKTKIQKKLAICKEWMKSSWNLDLEMLHKEVQERQKHIGELFD